MKKQNFLFILLVVLAFILSACSKPKYTISFETGTEEVIEAIRVTENEKAIEPTKPTRVGYEFLGWYNNEELYTFEEAVISDITLQAKWEIKKFTISFDTKTDEVVMSQEVEYNNLAVKPTDPVREGYEFLGWYNNDELFTFEENVTSDIDLVAKWSELNKYTVKFIVNGEVISSVEVIEGDSAIAPEPLELEGKTFVSWEGDYTNVTENREIVAVYTDNLYFVQFMVNGKEYGEAIGVYHGKSCITPEEPVIEGYKFSYWDQKTCNITSDVVVNAVFELVEYEIKYYSDGVLLSDMEPSKYTIEDNVVLPNYEIADYSFYAWFNNNDYDGDAINFIKAGSTNNLELHALNVKLELNGGSESWSTEFDVNHDAGKGINDISLLPEFFEMDFYKYLSDNNLLNSELVHSTCIASSWEVFSGINPNNNGDPYRIWNDTSTHTSKGADGYVSLFLYDELVLNDDFTVLDVKGGFLGTEPYKTKYRALLDLIVIMYQYKVETSNYTLLSANTNACRALMGFVIDGYFYGTQGIGKSYFSQARSVIPGIDFSYKLVDGTIVLNEYENKKVCAPVRENYVFAGWYLDSDLTILLGTNVCNNKCTLYAKWEEIK